jgi:hypothetical protein
MSPNKINLSSFRDPSGFIYSQDGVIYRQINTVYKDNYVHLMSAGLYENLIKNKLLIPHEEVAIEKKYNNLAYKVIKPINIPFISYPYEWSFSQLKHAALVTLKIQKIALDFGMSLKDASAYNIQFLNGKPIFIDTLSFEKYSEGRPWVAYKQFCQHFLGPIALMAYKDIRLNQLLRIYIDGVPLDLASTLLPTKTYTKFSLLNHIHLHAKSQQHYAGKKINKKNSKISRMGYLGIIDNLESTISNLKWSPKGTEWANYYEDTNYSINAVQSKKESLKKYLEMIKPNCVWDYGANTGYFSRIASRKGIQTIAFDLDPSAVEKNYLQALANNEENILPLLLDMTNPSPGIGWKNEERSSLSMRGPADAVLALALIHHLAISNNLPLSKIADYFAAICKWLIIEFVPKEDSQVQRLLTTREDIFAAYTQQCFEIEFEKYFIFLDAVRIAESERTLYLMKREE